MSAAKMVADSTQGDVPEMSSTKKRKKVVQKKKVKRKKDSAKKSKKKSQEDEFDVSDLDLDKVVQPMGYYVKDRENLLKQMFHCVRGQSLNRALPDVLKELPLDDLKKRCMEQLEVMSKKRIRRILAGDDPASISSSGTEDETSEEETLEMEEGEVDYGGIEAPVVDSTSLYTHETGDSDREFDYEEGSIGHSSQSPYPSDDEQTNQQYEGDSADREANNRDVQMEDDTNDTIDNNPDSEQSNTPQEPEEPEEGEVIDDNSDSGEVIDSNSEEADSKDSGEVIDNNTGKEISNNPGETSVKEFGETNRSYSRDSIQKNLGENTEIDKGEDNSEIPKEGETTVDLNNDSKDSTNIMETEGAEDKSDSVDNSESNDKDNKTENKTNKTENTDKENETSENAESDIRIVKTDETGKKAGEEENEQRTEKEGEVEKTEDAIEVDDDHVFDANIDSEHVENENSDEGEVLEEQGSKEVDKSISEVVVSEVKKVQQSRRIVKLPSKDIAPALTRNQMELLELQMRARAIKAMLKTAK